MTIVITYPVTRFKYQFFPRENDAPYRTVTETCPPARGRLSYRSGKLPEPAPPGLSYLDGNQASLVGDLVQFRCWSYRIWTEFRHVLRQKRYRGRGENLSYFYGSFPRTPTAAPTYPDGNNSVETCFLAIASVFPEGFRFGFYRFAQLQ